MVAECMEGISLVNKVLLTAGMVIAMSKDKSSSMGVLTGTQQPTASEGTVDIPHVMV